MALVKKIRQLARENPRYGYRRTWALLRRDGVIVNRKKVQRLWRQEGLGLPKRRTRRKVRSGLSVPLSATHPRHVWTYDFVQDATADGRQLKLLTLMDEFTREAIAIQVDRRMPSAAVIAVLSAAIAQWGPPEFLRSDNGPEFIAKLLQNWLASRGIKTHYIEPGSPWQNAFGESFNEKLRTECLNVETFYSVEEARVVIEAWRRHYNGKRPHSSLGYRTPEEFRKAWKQSGSLPPALGSLCSPSGAGRRKGTLRSDRIQEPVRS